MIIRDSNFEKLTSYNDEILRKELYSNENTKKYTKCPHCESENIIKFGSYKGIQRYKCKICNKTFSNSTNSMWKYLKHSPEKWIKFLELLFEEKTIKECAESLEISMVTAFNWRHKVLHRIEKLYNDKGFNDLIFMELNRQRISYKGSRKKHFEFESKFNKRYNICHEDVFTIISYDINDEIIVKNIGINDRWSNRLDSKLSKDFENDIYNNCNSKAYIHINPQYAKPIYSRIIEHNKKVPYKIRNMYEFNPKNNHKMDNIKCNDRVNNISVKLNKWLGKFRGVATKYLNHYCNLFALSFVKKEYDYIKVFFDLLKTSSFYTSVKILNETHLEDY